MTGDIYTSGEYLAKTHTWHVEDAEWKASQIARMAVRNHLRPGTVAEIGCGAGAILSELSARKPFVGASFTGFDISPQAIDLCEDRETERVRFLCEDLLSPGNTDYFDVLLIIDVIEHVRDYMGFAERCKTKATHKIYHIPLDVHVSSVLRNGFNATREAVGHLHYFTADAALATLKDTGHEIVDVCYTNVALGTFRQHPSLRRAFANVPRWLFSRVNLPATARVFGGYSLLVLAR